MSVSYYNPDEDTRGESDDGDDGISLDVSVDVGDVSVKVAVTAAVCAAALSAVCLAGVCAIRGFQFVM